MLNRGKTIAFIIIIFCFSCIKAEISIYVDNPALTLEENEYLSRELNSVDLTTANESIVIDKYYKLREALNLEDNANINFKIQIIKNLLFLAEILDDDHKTLEIFEDYFEKYADFDKNNSHYLHASYCTLKQIMTEDKDQEKCFTLTSKLYKENLTLKIFRDPFYFKSYQGYFQRYQIALMNYFASKRTYTDDLCAVIEDYQDNLNEGDLLDYEVLMFIIKDDLNNYEDLGLLSKKDQEVLRCAPKKNNLK